jgi:ABC-2 type transport system ATP-binding protein
MLAVETIGLTKDYGVGFWRKRSKRALDGLNLRVEPCEIFGLLGPNGAGKSSTLKTLLRLIFPTSGTARVLGRDVRDISLHAHVGYLPQNPCFYDHLTAEEFLNYAGELFGLSASERRRRVGELLERVGLTDSRSVPLGKFSEGMVQRLGIAQALINDPSVLFLDEPMSGLDPLGRREVRDAILQLKAEGKTVLFSTHILSDAEMLCDRVAILNRGRLEGCGGLRQMLGLGIETIEIVLEDPPPDVVNELEPRARSTVRTGNRVQFALPAECDVHRILDLALHRGARIVSLNPVRMSLEDYFLRQVAGGNSETGDSTPETLRRQIENHEPSQAATHPPASSDLAIAGSRSRAFSVQSRARASAGRVAAIVLHTFKESVRDNVVYSLVVLALLLIGASILLGWVSVGIGRTLLVNLGLSAISVIGLVMAIFIGVGLVSKEIERRSIHNILSKPVRRAEFMLGKYFGLLLTLAVNTGVLTAGFYLALFFQRRGLDWGDLGALGAIYFILLELALVVGLALLFSSISTPVLSAVYTLALYVIGNFSSDLRELGRAARSAPVERVTAALYYALPNFSDFNAITLVAHGERIPRYLAVSNSLYALLYATILLSAAILIFEERELG